MEKKIKQLGEGLKGLMISCLDQILNGSFTTEEVTAVHEKLHKAFLIFDMLNLLVQKEKQIPENLVKELADRLVPKK